MSREYTHESHFTTPNNKPVIKKISYWRVTFLISIFVLIIVGGVYAFKKYYLDDSDPDAYQAVFMQNGQVYFGKMMGEKDGYVLVERPYYIQSPNSTSNTSQSIQTNAEISLVRVGSELHAPESYIYLNKDHIIFFEDLRTDSRVLRSIISNEKK